MSIFVRRAMCSLAQSQIRSARVPSQAASFSQRRGYFFGDARDIFFYEPTRRRRSCNCKCTCKEEEPSTVVGLLGLGLLLYGGYIIYKGDEEEEEEEES